MYQVMRNSRVSALTARPSMRTALSFQWPNRSIGAYPDLMEAGVKIYEYLPGFVHSKQVLVDDEIAVVGTINFDYRSLVHHYENAIWMYETPEIPKIRADFDNIFAVSREIKLETFRVAWYQHLVKEIMQLFAPML